MTTSWSTPTCAPRSRPRSRIAPVPTWWRRDRVAGLADGTWPAGRRGAGRRPARASPDAATRRWSSTPSPPRAEDAWPTPSGATRPAASAACSTGPSGCPTSRPASRSRPRCRPAGSPSHAMARQSSTTRGSRSVRPDWRARAAGRARPARQSDLERARRRSSRRSAARRDGAPYGVARRVRRSTRPEPRRRGRGTSAVGAEEAERAAARETEAIAREAGVARGPARAAGCGGRPPAGGSSAMPARTGAAGRAAPRRATRAAASRPGRPAPPSCASGAIAWPRSRPRTTARRRDAEHARARAEAAATIAEERVARADRELAAPRRARDARSATERDRSADRARRRDHARGSGTRRARRAARRRMPPTARDWRKPSEPRRRRGSGCAPPTNGLAPPTTPSSRRASASSRCARACSSSLPASGELGLASLGVERPQLTGGGCAVDGRGHQPTGRPDADAETEGRARTQRARGGSRGLAERWAAEPPTGRCAVARPSRPAPPPLPRARRGQPVRRRGVRRAQGPPRDARDAGRRTCASAIAKTRELIAELDTMIADQFRTTFAALETAFERRFEQLFGGGFAQLSLTDPDRPRRRPASRSSPGRPARSRRRWRCCRAASGR